MAGLGGAWHTCWLVAGFQWSDIEKCVKWMVPFAMVIRETGSSKLKQFRGVPAEDAHNIQTHLSSLDLLVSLVPKHGASSRVPSRPLRKESCAQEYMCLCVLCGVAQTSRVFLLFPPPPEQCAQ